VTELEALERQLRVCQMARDSARADRDQSDSQLRHALAAFGEFVLAYRRIYMETQTHPTVAEENEVMAKARALCDEFGLKHG
jgi:hypothetical protein